MSGGRLEITKLAMREAWFSQVIEDIIEPGREIIDPHHHLWAVEGLAYEHEALRDDTGAGHNVVKTVFIECREHYLEEGPEALRPVGETRYAARIAAETAVDPHCATIAGIVSHADLRSHDLDAVLDAHEAAGGGLFRGIRHAGSCDSDTEALIIPGRAPSGLYHDADFRRGLARLGERGLTYDTWHYHHQNADFVALARAVPDTTLVLDHLGTPLGVGRFAGKRESIFAQWRDDIAEIAAYPNVVAKLGGLAMPDNGFGWHERRSPPTSDQFADAYRPWYSHAIACFGPERCMFESNFPVDRVSVSYAVLWNAFKKIAADHDEAAKKEMFSGTAQRVYRLS